MYGVDVEVSVGVVVDGVLYLVVEKGKEAHGGQNPTYTRKPLMWLLA